MEPPPFAITLHSDLDDARMYVRNWANRARQSWVPTVSEPKTLSFTRTRPIDGFVLVVLLLLGIIPGLLYAILASQKQKETLNVYFKEAEGGTRITLQAGGNTTYHGRSLANDLRQIDSRLESPPVSQPANSRIAVFPMFLFVAGAIAFLLTAVVAAWPS